MIVKKEWFMKRIFLVVLFLVLVFFMFVFVVDVILGVNVEIGVWVDISGVEKCFEE